MGVDIIVTKSYDRNYEDTGLTITQEEWLQYIEDTPNLSQRVDDHAGMNPMTKEPIRIKCGAAESILHTEQEDMPFLSHGSGSLSVRLYFDYEDPSDPVRIAIAEVAHHFGALITHDAGDEFFDW